METFGEPPDKELIFSFGSYRLIPSRQLLLLEDRPVKVGGRVFELLRMLVQRAGELVGKDELMAAVWPGTFVHESNLKVNMHSLRRSLGDTHVHPTYIATIGGRGYRFVAKVVEDFSRLPETPDLRSGLYAPTPLPISPDIVGREREIEAILDALRDERHVTVVGTGGVGKTTLAIAAARAFHKNCPDGVCFIDLATIDDPALLPVTALAALGAEGKPGDELAACIHAARSRRMLVILDNCEHLLPAAALFADGLVGSSGNVKLLATSREPLRTSREHTVRVEPLSSPNPGSSPGVDEALGFPAVELFVRRASQWAGYELIEADCAAIASICHALDGLPLALELVAAKVATHSLKTLSEMLDVSPSFRRVRTRPYPHRQQTLMATLDWSFKLLPPAEANIFRLVSVFADSFELEDVIAVANVIGMTTVAVVTAVGGLVSKSLLPVESRGDTIRYRLLDTTRRYAVKKRRDDARCSILERAHAQRILDLFERAEAEWGWRDTGEWEAHYADRIADLRAALSWAFGESGDRALGIRLTVAAIPLWSEITALSEAPRWVETALAAAQAIGAEDLLKAKLACFRAWIGQYLANPSAGEKAWNEAIAFAERADNLEYQQRGLLGLAACLLKAGKVADAIDRLRQSDRLSERYKDWSAASDGHRALAWTKAHGGELAAGRRVLQRLATRDPLGRRDSRLARHDIHQSVTTRCYLTFTAFVTGHADFAAMVTRDAVEMSGRSRCWVSLSDALGLAALPLSLETGDFSSLERHTKQLHSNLQYDGMASWIPVYRYYSGQLLDLQGRTEGLGRIRDAIAELVDCGRLHWIAIYLAGLARVLVRHERFSEAQDAVTMALHHQEQQGERWCRPELLRIQASILLRDGQGDGGENQLRAALAEARAMDAALFELRIASDLATYHLDAGRPAAAAQELGTVYRNFSEGFATQDMVTASRLLARAAEN